LDKVNNNLWADNGQQYYLGQFIYKTYSMKDFDDFNKVYNWPYCGLPCGDFSKPGMGNNSKAEHKDWEPSLEGILYSNDTDEMILVELEFKDTMLEYYGAPKQVVIKYIFSNRGPLVDIDVQWFYKQKTRLAESIWFSFNPITSNPGLWVLDVMGYPINPYEVIVNGSRHVHAIWKGVSYNDALLHKYLEINSLDCALVSPGDTEHLLNFAGTEQPKVENGMHFNLYNNLWGTAFNQWYDDDARFRFSLVFG